MKEGGEKRENGMKQQREALGHNRTAALIKQLLEIMQTLCSTTHNYQTYTCCKHEGGTRHHMMPL